MQNFLLLRAFKQNGLFGLQPAGLNPTPAGREEGFDFRSIEDRRRTAPIGANESSGLGRCRRRSARQSKRRDRA
jgi:hypothetical protein